METKIKDSKLRKLLKKKQDLILGLREKGKEAIKLQAELDKLAVKRNNYIAQIHEVVDKIDLDLGEFDAIESVELKGGDVVVSTFNVIEEFKIQYLKDKEDDKSKPSIATDTEKNTGTKE